MQKAVVFRNLPALHKQCTLSIILLVISLLSIVNVAAQTIPANDNFKDAEKIIISNGGFGLGTFQSTKTDITKATKEAGESLHLLQYFAGTDKKTVWFVFETKATRNINIEIRQQDTLIRQDAVGITIYQTNSKTRPPNLGEVDNNLTPLSKFGSTGNTCLFPGKYYVQVSAKANANAQIWLNLFVGDPSPALYNKNTEAYEFDTLKTGSKKITFDVGCQDMDYNTEQMKALGLDYNQSVWLTFKTGNYLDFLRFVFQPIQKFSGPDSAIFGYRLYKGDAKNALGSLKLVDSVVLKTRCSNSYFYPPTAYAVGCGSVEKKYFCEIEANTVYTIQLIFHKRAKYLFSLEAETRGDKAALSSDPKNLPKNFQIGVLRSYGTAYINDNFACNSLMRNNLCGKLNIPQVIDTTYRHSWYYKDGVKTDTIYSYIDTFDMSLWTTFEVKQNGYITLENTKNYCNSYDFKGYFAYHVYKGDITQNCNLPLYWKQVDNAYGSSYSKEFCLEPGIYSLQILGNEKSSAYKYYYNCAYEDLSKDVKIVLRYFSNSFKPAQHYQPNNPEDMGDITAKLKTGVSSKIDNYEMPDDSIYIDGEKYLSRFNYRQFYISAPTYLTIDALYTNNLFGGNVLFSGRVSQGIDSLKRVPDSLYGKADFGTFINIFKSTCKPLPAGWYTVLSYMKTDCVNFGGNSQIRIKSFEPCFTSFNRPYKASYAGNLDWDASGTPGKTNVNYALAKECFACSQDEPFSRHPLYVCKQPADSPQFIKVAYYVFNLKQESFIRISAAQYDVKDLRIGNGTVQLFAGDVRRDSLKFRAPAFMMAPCDSFNEFCRLQPGVYTIAILSAKSGIFKPYVQVEKAGFSLYDHASHAADLGHIPPTGKEIFSKEDAFYCTTGAQYTDPASSNYFYEYLKQPSSVLYPMPVNHPQNNDDYIFKHDQYYLTTKYQKNLWYTFTCSGTGEINVKATLLSWVDGGNYNIRIFKSNEKYFGPFNMLVAAGKVDSSIVQGLELVNSFIGDLNVNFKKIGCDTVRYYILLERTLSYYTQNYQYYNYFNAYGVKVSVQYKNAFTNGEAGDYCSNAVPLTLNKTGETSASAIINCHSRGESFGEDGSNMACLVLDTMPYKTSWFKFTYSGKETVDLSFRLENKSNAQASQIHYRVLYGTCDAMTPGPCVANALSYFTLDCMGHGDYYVQVVSPANAGGNITLFAKAAPSSYDICKPIELLRPSANFSYTGGCNNSPVKFRNLSSAGKDIVYTWDFGNGTSSANKNPQLQFAPKQFIDTFWVTLKVTNSKSGLYDELTLPVIVFRDPVTLTLKQKEFTIQCDEKVNLEASSNYAYATYEWFPKNGLDNPYSATPVFTPTSGSRTFTVVLHAENCILTDTVHIYLRPKILISGDKLLCFGKKGMLSAPAGFANYYWSTGQNTQAIDIIKPGKYWGRAGTNSGCYATDTIIVKDGSAGIVDLGNDTTICPEESIVLKSKITGKNPLWSTGETTSQIIVNKTGKYWLRMENDYCTGYDTIEIFHKPKPFVNLNDTMYICGGNAVWVDISKPGQKYLWSNGSKSGQLFLKEPGKYFVMITEDGCVSIDSVMVEAAQLPVISLHDTSFCSDFSFTIDAGDWKAYNWQPGNTTERELTVNTFGQYVVKVTDNKGCENSDTVNVTQECNPQIWVPNAFTPFNDAPNNTFKPEVYDISTIEMKVYNRWGELVFVTRDMNKGWDGTFEGKPCIMDVYLWTIAYTGYHTNKYIYGTVTLLR